MKVFRNDDFSAALGDTIAYSFYGRTGGVSGGIYASLNCGPGSGDAPNNVAKNRSIVAINLCGNDVPISTLCQYHSADCFYITEPVITSDERPQGDALVTDVAGLPIACLTADCGPVLFAAKKSNGAPVIGAAHAGWGGALGGVLEATVQKMREAGAVPETVTACIGPCIRQASYEVSADFAAPFKDKHPDASAFFVPGQKPGHFMFDLPRYIAFRLSLCGVRAVHDTGGDTYGDEENCFSYRRATHRWEEDYGRQISVIVIR
jgi:hypothetical protein